MLRNVERLSVVPPAEAGWSLWRREDWQNFLERNYLLICDFYPLNELIRRFFFLTLCVSFWKKRGIDISRQHKHVTRGNWCRRFSLTGFSGSAALYYQLVELMQQCVVYEEPLKPKRRVAFSAFLLHPAVSSQLRSGSGPAPISAAPLGGSFPSYMGS